jgi:hypothetical protein
MLKTFTDAMSQKHPISVITDGDLAMQRAIKVDRTIGCAYGTFSRILYAT